MIGQPAFGFISAGSAEESGVPNQPAGFSFESLLQLRLCVREFCHLYFCTSLSGSFSLYVTFRKFTAVRHQRSGDGIVSSFTHLEFHSLCNGDALSPS